MNHSLCLNDDWEILLSMLPAGWKELGRSTNAITRKLRNFDSEEGIMRAFLLHIASGYSLRETVARLKIAKIATISDVALLKRLKCSENWLKELCICLLKERGVLTSNECDNVTYRIVDGTNVKEPGKTGSLWRIHYSLTLPDLFCDYFKLTSNSGKGTGESFKQFPIQKGECIVGDRGYSTSQGIAYIDSKEAYTLVRVNSTTLQFVNQDNNFIDLQTAAKSVKNEHEAKEWIVGVISENKVINGRLCILRKDIASQNMALKKLKRRSQRKQAVLNVKTKELAGYVILFTTLPTQNYPLDRVLKCYRFRWQVELAFKRLKSLVGLGHLPKHDDVSARAWLYGKLFVGLLIEKLIAYEKIFPPRGVF